MSATNTFNLGNNFNQLLSVCIPTYNRASYLDQCLSVLVPQAIANNINIIISDNASTDATSEIISKYRQDYSGITCYYQPHNVGYDLNHKTVIKLAKTEFSWLLGDDDVIMEGALKKVIDVLRSNLSCELLLINGIITDNEMRPTGSQFSLKENILLSNCNDLMKSYGDKLTFGMVIINSRMFNQINADRFIGTAHFYSGGVYEYLAVNYLLKHSNSILILKDPLVCLRQGEREWTDLMGDIAVRQIPEFYFRVHRLYQDNARQAIKKITGSYRTWFALIRLRGSKGLDEQGRIRLRKYYFPDYKMWFIVISKLPVKIAKGLTTLGVFLVRLRRMIKRFFLNWIVL